MENRKLYSLVSAVTIFGSLFGLKSMLDFIGENRVMNSLFLGTYRLSFSLPIAWLIYASHRGCGGIVNRILSSRFWIPLSKLSYSLYLISSVVQHNLVASQPHEISFESHDMVSLTDHDIFHSLTNFHQFFNFLYELFLSIVGAIFLHILVEQPAIEFAKKFFNQKQNVKM